MRPKRKNRARVPLLVTAIVLIASVLVSDQQSASAYWVYSTTTYKNSDASKNVYYSDWVYSTRYKDILTVSSFYTQFGTVQTHVNNTVGGTVSASSSIVWSHPDWYSRSKCKWNGDASGPIPIKCQYKSKIWVV